MIAPEGYILLESCETYWMERYIELNFQQTVDALKANLEDVKESVIIDHVTEDIPFEAANDFISAIKSEEISLLYENKIFSVSNKIFDMFNDDAMGENLGISGELTIEYHPQDHIDFICLPRWYKNILFYLEPSNWTVDTRGYDFISKNLPKTYNPFIKEINEYFFDIAYQEREIEVIKNGDFNEELVDLEDPTQIAYYDFINNEADNDETKSNKYWPIPDRGYDVHLYGDQEAHQIEYWHLNHQTPFSKLTGASLCLKLEIWLKVKAELDKSSKITKENIKRTISEETISANKIFEYLLENSTQNMTKQIIKKQFGAHLGERAFIRVWNKVTEQYPELKTPGRRSK